MGIHRRCKRGCDTTGLSRSRRCGRLHPCRTAAAEGFFKHVLATKPPTEPGKAPDPFRNLAAHIEAGILAPTELILAKDG